MIATLGEPKKEEKKCKDCASFSKCVTESANIAGIENTPKEIAFCMKIKACSKFRE